MSTEARRYPGESHDDCTSRILDSFYTANGPCCAGCDWWQPANTAVPNRGKPAADGPRYKALGNSWAVPNVRWIGERIAAVSEIIKSQKAVA